MNGAQDMGGVHGFGAVAVEPDEPVFHAEWERRVFALTRAMGATGEWNLDEVRFARENREPVEYLAMSYYERWLAGLERLLVERGLVGSDELVAGRSLRPGRAVPRVLAASGVATFGPATSRREAPRPARFAPAITCAPRTSTPRVTHACHTTCGQDRHDRPSPRRPCLSGLARPWVRRRSAMAVHGLLRRPVEPGGPRPTRR